MRSEKDTKNSLAKKSERNGKEGQIMGKVSIDFALGIEFLTMHLSQLTA